MQKTVKSRTPVNQSASEHPKKKKNPCTSLELSPALLVIFYGLMLQVIGTVPSPKTAAPGKDIQPCYVRNHTSLSFHMKARYVKRRRGGNANRSGHGNCLQDLLNSLIK